MQIENAVINDIPEIFRLYAIAAAHQQQKKIVTVWPTFKQQMVETDITENRQWKLLIDGVIACVWSTTFSDEYIWEARNADGAVYLHRIATNSNFRGNNYVAIIVEWAKAYAIKNNKAFVRLDTTGNNVQLIAHYTRAGFNFLGMFELENTSELPQHYQGMPVCLFEINLQDNKI